ncbi:MAG: arsenate reductase (glutaredoxin) [Mariprofundaceae bacterium]
MSVIIYHNPRCSKSRTTLSLLQEQGIEAQIIEYLKTPLSEADLDKVLSLLGKEPEELMRKGEAEYKEFVKGKALSRQEQIRVMVDHPILIERPIVIKGNRAAIGRPPESVLDIL